jgi:hypothetical protein
VSAGPVPVPPLPDQPVVHDVAAPVTWVLAAVAVALAVWFTVQVVRLTRGRSFSLRRVLLTGLAMVLAVVAAAVTDVHRRSEERDARVAWARQVQSAADDAQAALEATYGITFGPSPLIPLEASAPPRRETVTLPDGSTEDCFVAVDAAHYAIACGGESFETSTPLEPVAP